MDPYSLYLFQFMDLPVNHHLLQIGRQRGREKKRMSLRCSSEGWKMHQSVGRTSHEDSHLADSQ